MTELHSDLFSAEHEKQLAAAKARMDSFTALPDWQIAPAQHHKPLAEAGFHKLNALLASPKLAALINEFEQNDAVANKAQKRFFRLEKIRIWLFFIALAIGAIGLLPLDILLWERAAEQANIFQFAALGLAILALLLLRRHKPDIAWRMARARAEIARGTLFHKLLEEVALTNSKAADIKPAEIAQNDDTDTAALPVPLALQAVEYMRRYHIDVQYDYYQGRARQHMAQARRRRFWLGLATFLGVLTIIPMLMLAAEWLHRWTGIGETAASYAVYFKATFDAPGLWFSQLFLALGTICAGLEASVTNSYRMFDNIDNAVSYNRTGSQLGRLYVIYMKKIRLAALAGNVKPALQFIQAANALLFREHRKWQAAQSNILSPLPTLKELTEKAS